MQLKSNLSLGFGAVILSWNYLATNWSSSPTEVGTATVNTQAGVVLSYVLSDVTRYRFVPDTYSATLDAFYGVYSGSILSDLIVARG
jgi:hypothetical protein